MYYLLRAANSYLWYFLKTPKRITESVQNWNYQRQLPVEAQTIYQKLTPKYQHLLRESRQYPHSIIQVSPEQLVSENNHTRAYLQQINGTSHYNPKHFHMYSILKDYTHHGLEYIQHNLTSYPYFKFYQLLWNQPEATEHLKQKVFEKFLKLEKIYLSIKDHNYPFPDEYSFYIFVKQDNDSDMYQIISGHHRSCCLYLLETTLFPVILLVDKKL